MTSKKEPETQPPKPETIESREITEELRESYLDYAMSVIVARALPDARDGLKPVQRRILWAMWSMGLTHTAKFMKSARVVGETLGKFHPHGDAALYDTMVRMAQDFSLRYPLVEGQGNMGSVDGDSAAAQRYTEARLSKIAEELLQDIEKETVEWKPNYDNSREEPAYLPAKLPNLLINGTMGIAVGMATSIPPHNLGEVADAAIHLARHPDASIKELMQFIHGPDFPTGGVIYDKKSIEEAYRTGRGPVTIRGVAEIETGKRGSRIIITEIPYQVNKADLITKIAELVETKKIAGIRDLRDESDREGMRIVIDLKSDTVPERVINQLYRYTDFQKNFNFNMVALIDGLQPKVLSIKDLLQVYLEHRKIIVRKRTEFELKKAEERAHILAGLVKALGSIDKVIAVIKRSKDKNEAKSNLMKRFILTAIQAEAILEMKLHTLAALERKKLEEELREKKHRIAELKGILKEPKKIIGIIAEELSTLKKSFPEPRRTKLVTAEIRKLKDEDLIPKEETVLVITDDGYVKRMAPGLFRRQKRGGKGMIGFDVREEDKIREFLRASTHDSVLFFTDKGKVFRTKMHEIPQGTRTAKGRSIHNFLSLSANEKITTTIAYSDSEEVSGEFQYLVMVTKNGIIKKVALADLANVRKNGIVAISLQNGDILKWAGLSSGNDEFIIASEKGQAIRFKENEVRAMGRGAAGIKGITLKKGDAVAGFDVIRKKDAEKNQMLLSVTARGFAKQTPIKEYKTQRRGGSGIKTMKITEKTGNLIASRTVVDKSVAEVLALSAKGQAIRVALSSIRRAGRATQGVKIMNLANGDALTGIICL